ncbi:class D beta-lactamase [Colwellia sp. RSH04]|nr:class D beta-lactamase [Colwellia sp. RSH04]
MFASVNALTPVFATLSQSGTLCKEGDSSCTFVLLSEMNNDQQETVINNERANLPLSPFSTFKVANSLIALDKGIIKNAQQSLTFDKEKYPVQPWWPKVWQLPQYNLSTAFKFSMVAIYRQLATDIGEQDMQAYIKKMHYGNQDISSGLDDFWLNKSMKISAKEQIEFLQSFYHNSYQFNEQAISTLKTVMLADENKNYKLYAKTGAGKVKDGSMLGWYIGFVENDKGVHFFAFNFNKDSYPEMKALRQKVAYNHLKAAGII